MLMQSSSKRQTDPRERGSVYVLVLGASLLVAVIGISSLLAARVQRRTVANSADLIQARELARAGIDFVIYGEDKDLAGSIWRGMLNDGGYQGRPLAGGVFSVNGVDPVDGDVINDDTNPVVLTSVGKYGNAKYILQVTIDTDGIIQPGTWKRVVN